MSAASDSTGVTHSVQKLLLIRARFLTRQLNLNVDGPAIRNTVAPDIGLAVIADVDNATVFREELAHRMIDGIATVFTQSRDNLVL